MPAQSRVTAQARAACAGVPTEPPSHDPISTRSHDWSNRCISESERSSSSASSSILYAERKEAVPGSCGFKARPQKWRVTTTRPLNVIAIGALIVMGTSAHALDAISRTAANTRTHAISRTPTLKRQAIVQLSTCMTKRMAADRVITYYGAMKFCKDKLNQQVADSASRTLLASVAPATP